MSKHKDVASYIEASDIEARPLLNEIRELIKSTIPKAEEKISYNVPFYKYHGEFVGFAAYQKHVSFGYGSDVLQNNDREFLEHNGYKLGKGTMQIKFGQKLPVSEIKKILLYKAQINEAKADKRNIQCKN